MRIPKLKNRLYRPLPDAGLHVEGMHTMHCWHAVQQIMVRRTKMRATHMTMLRLEAVLPRRSAVAGGSNTVGSKFGQL